MSLDDSIINEKDGDYLATAKVKEFIKELKEKIRSSRYVDDCIPKEALPSWIDELAGGRLI